MNEMNDLLTFAGVMALGQFSPGPDMILLTRTALKSGARVGVEMSLGIACGLAVHATVAVGGLALAFDRLPRLRQGMDWAAAGYLLWLAWRISDEILTGRHSGGGKETGGPVSSRRPFFRGFFCNLLNPKVAIILAALSAPFLRGERPDGWALAIWGIIVCQGWGLWSLWACILQWQPLRQSYERTAKWFDAAFVWVLAALAVRLIFR